jgi:hypothetical protein
VPHAVAFNDKRSNLNQRGKPSDRTWPTSALCPEIGRSATEVGPQCNQDPSPLADFQRNDLRARKFETVMEVDGATGELAG